MILNISFLRRVGLCCKCLRSEYIFLKKSAFIRTGCKLIKHCMRYNWHSLDVSGMIYKQNKKYFTSKEFKNLAGCLRWWFLFSFKFWSLLTLVLSILACNCMLLIYDHNFHHFDNYRLLYSSDHSFHTGILYCIVFLKKFNYSELLMKDLIIIF